MQMTQGGLRVADILYSARLARASARTKDEMTYLDNNGDDVLDAIADEMARAMRGHGPMRGPHEGWAVILEEVDELWDEVKKKTHDKDRMREEAIQIAAMAARFVVDVCGGAA